MGHGTALKEKKGVEGMVLDFGEKGSDDVLWALEVRLGERLGDKILVSRGDVAHVVASRNNLGLVRRVLDVVLDVFQFSFEVAHVAAVESTRIRTFPENTPTLYLNCCTYN